MSLLGERPVRFAPIYRGYTPALRGVATLASGERVFAKLATNADTASWLRIERKMYARLQGSYLPTVRGWQDGPMPLLLLEDLSSAHWPPPWRPGEIDAVRDTLAQIAAQPADDLPAFDVPPGWQRVADNPAPMLSLGLVSPDWLDAALPVLIDAEARAPVAGSALLHGDVRSDNLCLRDGRAILVDWNWACRGNPNLDLAFWSASLALEGGPLPEAILPDAPHLAALVSGFFASRAGLPRIPHAPHVRQLQLAQLRHALPWAARALSLPAQGLSPQG